MGLKFFMLLSAPLDLIARPVSPRRVTKSLRCWWNARGRKTGLCRQTWRY